MSLVWREVLGALEHGDQSFQDPLDQMTVKWLLVLTRALHSEVGTHAAPYVFIPSQPSILMSPPPGYPSAEAS